MSFAPDAPSILAAMAGEPYLWAFGVLCVIAVCLIVINSK
jgi:hypothetical protein